MTGLAWRAVLVMSACAVLPVPTVAEDPPTPGAARWIEGMNGVQETASEVAQAHRAAMSFVDDRVLAAELEIVCRALHNAEKDARVRLRVPSASPAGRIRAAVLPEAIARLASRGMCKSGKGRAPVDGGAGSDLPGKLDQAVTLLELTPMAVAQAEQVLLQLEGSADDFEEATLELTDWASRHDELVRKLAAMNLALRHVGHGQRAGQGEKAFDALMRKLGEGL